jgi:hypothetical protein
MIGTIAVDASGRPRFPLTWAMGVDRVVGLIYQRLGTQIGTWPEDVTIGLPLIGWLTEGRAPSPEEVAAVIRVQIERVGELPDVSIEIVRLAASVAAGRIDVSGELRIAVGGEVGVVDLGSLYTVQGLPTWYAAATEGC